MNNPIIHWAMVYKTSDTLFAFSEAGVPDLIKQTPDTEDDVADLLNLSQPILHPMLELMTSAKLVEYTENHYPLRKNTVNALPVDWLNCGAIFDVTEQ